jgi:hypothetical protein
MRNAMLSGNDVIIGADGSIAEDSDAQTQHSHCSAESWDITR